MNEYPASYYAHNMIETPEPVPLTGRISADVCIIGAGYAGLTCALELAKAGIDAVVLEAERVGWGASGRNGGFVSPRYAQDLDAIIKTSGLQQARELFELSREGVAAIRAMIARYDMRGVDLVPGYLHVQRYDDAQNIDKIQNQLAVDFSYEVKTLDREELGDLLLTRRYHQAWYESDEAFHIQPLNYALGLARAARTEGARIFEHSRVTRLERGGDIKTVHTQQGQIRCKHVVFCASAYMKGVFAPVSSAILPVATYVVATEPLGERLAAAIKTGAAIVESRRASNYYRITGQNRLLWGGRITTRQSEPAALAAMMKRDILEVYPQLGDFKIDFAWGGLMGYAVHKMPLIGQIRPNIWVASAFGGHGLNTATAGGMLIAGAIAHGSGRYKLFAPYKARWAGGMLGRAAVQLSYWKMQLQDKIRETMPPG